MFYFVFIIRKNDGKVSFIIDIIMLTFLSLSR
jgi:hypothetical protein